MTNVYSIETAEKELESNGNTKVMMSVGLWLMMMDSELKAALSAIMEEHTHLEKMIALVKLLPEGEEKGKNAYDALQMARRFSEHVKKLEAAAIKQTKRLPELLEAAHSLKD